MYIHITHEFNQSFLHKLSQHRCKSHSRWSLHIFKIHILCNFSENTDMPCALRAARHRQPHVGRLFPVPVNLTYPSSMLWFLCYPALPLYLPAALWISCSPWGHVTAGNKRKQSNVTAEIISFLRYNELSVARTSSEQIQPINKLCMFLLNQGCI